MWLIKIGGGETIHLEGIIRDLAEYQETCIILHGANAVRDQLAQKLGIQKRVVQSLSGYSSVLSDQSIIDLQMMAYAGLRNKRIIELCQRYGLNAIGLSGIDGKCIQGKRNAGIRVREGGKNLLLKDFSGKPQGVNRALLELLLEHHYVPVLTVPILDEQGFAINSENDDILQMLHATFHAEKIFQFIEAPGFLENKDDSSSLVSFLTVQELAQKEAQVEGRMKRKLLALRKLFEHGPTVVFIADGRTEHPLKDALAGKGTRIQ